MNFILKRPSPLSKRIEEVKTAAANALAVIGYVAVNIDAAPRAAKEVVEWGLKGAPLAGEKDLAARRAICGACDRWQPTKPGSLLMHCADCKCLAAKLAMATTRCPLGKWEPVNSLADRDLERP